MGSVPLKRSAPGLQQSSQPSLRCIEACREAVDYLLLVLQQHQSLTET